MYINSYQSSNICQYQKTNTLKKRNPSYENNFSMNGMDIKAQQNIAFRGWLFSNKNSDKNNEEFTVEEPTVEEPPVEEPTDNSIADEIKLSPQGEIISLKLAMTMPKLNDKSLIVIGNPDSGLFCTDLHRSLTGDNGFLPNPSVIEDIYVIKAKNEWPLSIAKKSDDKYCIRGCVKNLSSEVEKEMSIYPVWHDEPVVLGDLIDIECGPVIRVDKLDTESDDVQYDRYYNAIDIYSEMYNGHKETDIQSQEVDSVRNETNSSIPFRTFDDVAGLNDTVLKMKHEILFPIIYPDAFPNTMNKGTILYGEPGTGKTLLVLATIGEAKKIANKNINLVEIDAAGTTRELVGQSEEVWRDAFDDAIKKQPSILFIDELDAVLSTRGEDSNSNNYNSIVTQILKKMSDIEKRHDEVWVIGATNRLNAIDPAVKRSGRFGNHIEVKRPDKEGCKDIFELYTKNKNIEEFDRDSFYQMLCDKQQTGADIATMVDNALRRMYDRCGIYKKMEDGTFQYSDLENLTYIKDDFVPIDKNDINIKKVNGFKV